MLNGALTIYPEFIDVLGLLTDTCMVTGRYPRTSQLATARAVCTINRICVRFNTGVTQKPQSFNWYPQ
jgi:hypothetical protein